jgi:hypothetical protein
MITPIQHQSNTNPTQISSTPVARSTPTNDIVSARSFIPRPLFQSLKNPLLPSLSVFLDICDVIDLALEAQAKYAQT